MGLSITLRRAWLFAETPKGTTANAILYTVVETAKTNNLNVHEYLKYLLSEVPNVDFHNNPELLESYLPWSDKLPKECMMTINNRNASNRCPLIIISEGVFFYRRHLLRHLR